MDTGSIPGAYAATCVYCAGVVDTRAGNTYRFASGWTRGSNQGNTLTLALHADHYACHECIGRLKKGVAIGQTSLLEQADLQVSPPWHE